MIFAAAALAIATSAQQLASLSPVEQVRTQENLRKGELLYRYDQAAWHTSDAMIEHLPKAQRSRVRGWVVTPATTGDKTTYFGLEAGTPFLVYSAIWDGKTVDNEVIPPAPERQPLDGEELRLAQAVLTALPSTAKLRRCSDRPFNTVVLPGDIQTKPISMYFLTPQTEEGVFPFGGDYRIDVQNGRIVNQRAFTKSCISLSTRDTSSEKAVMLVITLSLDAIPTEIHVFGMFVTKQPLMVIVPDGRSYTLWAKKGVAQVTVDRFK